MEKTRSRADELGLVRAKLRAAFPAASFTTNDTANPATPMNVRATWGNGSIIKSVRADSPSSTVEQFLKKALPVFERFQRDNVPSKHLS